MCLFDCHVNLPRTFRVHPLHVSWRPRGRNYAFSDARTSHAPAGPWKRSNPLGGPGRVRFHAGKHSTSTRFHDGLTTFIPLFETLYMDIAYYSGGNHDNPT